MIRFTNYLRLDIYLVIYFVSNFMINIPVAKL